MVLGERMILMNVPSDGTSAHWQELMMSQYSTSDSDTDVDDSSALCDTYIDFSSVSWYWALNLCGNDEIGLVLFGLDLYLHPFSFLGKLGEIQAVYLIIQRKHRNQKV